MRWWLGRVVTLFAGGGGACRSGTRTLSLVAGSGTGWKICWAAIPIALTSRVPGRRLRDPFPYDQDVVKLMEQGA